MSEWTDYLPHVNASLNALATVLLISGYVLIRRGRETAHRAMMVSCFIVSVLFLASYLMYHYVEGSRRFPEYPPPWIRFTYLGVLLSHILLAPTVPLLAVATIYLAWRDRRAAHRRLARWTFPIWLYVSVTGVVVYLMLYQFYPSQLPLK